MEIAIVGGTGTVGGEAVRELERREHEVRILSPHAGTHPVDLRDGSGVAAALDGVDVVVNAANGDRGVLVDGTARLLRAAGEAGVRWRSRSCSRGPRGGRRASWSSRSPRRGRSRRSCTAATTR